MEYRPCANTSLTTSSSDSVMTSRCAHQSTDPSSREASLAPLKRSLHENFAAVDPPFTQPDQHSPHALFRPGWNLRNASHADSLPSRDLATSNQHGGHYAQSRPEKPSVTEPLPGCGHQRQTPLRNHQQRHHEATGSRKPLRTAASSPSLSTRKDSKTSLLSPPRHPALRARNASYDCQTLDRTQYAPLPFPPFDKPLPPIPITRQHSGAELAPTRAPASPDQRSECIWAPPPYFQAQISSSAELDRSKTDSLPPRTKIVVEVLGHMVALLKTQDEDSLMEFSDLVTSQARALRLETQKDVHSPIPVKF